MFIQKKLNKNQKKKTQPNKSFWTRKLTMICHFSFWYEKPSKENKMITWNHLFDFSLCFVFISRKLIWKHTTPPGPCMARFISFSIAILFKVNIVEEGCVSNTCCFKKEKKNQNKNTRTFQSWIKIKRKWIWHYLIWWFSRKSATCVVDNVNIETIYWKIFG